MNTEERFKALLNTDFPNETIKYSDVNRDVDPDVDTGIPIFSPRGDQEREKDKYDKKDSKYDQKDSNYVDRYTGLFAFAHIVLGHGGAEGLYRSINYAMLANLDRDAENTVLDVGCGVGRTLYDCSGLFKNTFFVGMDYAYKMCTRAKEILIEGKEISLVESLSYTGFDSRRLKLDQTKKAQNVFIAQGSVITLPFKNASFNCVVNTNLIDRVPDPVAAVSEMARILKPSGLFILCDPLNFADSEPQKAIPDRKTLIAVIKSRGIEITEWFDNLVYREVKDIRGNYEDFLTFVCVGRKG